MNKEEYVSIRDVFLNEVEDFQARHKMSDYKFSMLAMDDKAFLTRVKQGRDVQTRTIDKCLLFIKQYNANNPVSENENEAVL